MIKLGTQLRDVGGGAGGPVDALSVEAEEIDSLNALVDEERDGGVVTAEELIKFHAEDAIVGLKVRWWGCRGWGVGVGGETTHCGRTVWNG